MPAANRELIRAINRFEILHAIRINERVSRVDIARQTGLSQASVTGITADLIQEGLLIEKEAGASIGGRRPMLLAFNPEGAFALGVYLSIYNISTVIVNFEDTIVESYVLPLDESYYSPEDIVDRIVQGIHACIWQANFSKEQISGIGVGIPGLINSHTGTVRFMPNYRWENVHLRNLLTEKIDHPTYIENSANALTISEQWFGDGRGVDNFLLIALEHGVGMGVVINGRLYRGNTGIAGEFGHVTIDPLGPECRCGKRGCLETLVGNRAILREAKRAAEEGQWQPENMKSVTIEAVLEAAKRGEPALERIYADAGRTLGAGISNLIRLFNPAKVIISGRGTDAGNMLFDSMFETIPEQTSERLNYDPEIIIKPWNQIDYARGAGAVVLQEIYKSPANRMIPII